MSPVETSKQEGWLERPEEAFAFYRDRGQSQVVLQEKHMGSRALVLVCRDATAARARLGTVTDEGGAIWTRTGRAFFNDRAMSDALLERARQALAATGLWDELNTNWVLLDAEIMPWSAKASSLIENQYAPVAAASQAGLSAAHGATARALARGIDVNALHDRLADRLARARKYASAWAPHAWPVNGVDDLRVAPFHVLASEGAVHFDKPHAWHMAIAERLAAIGAPVLAVTPWRTLALDDEKACAEGAAWWEERTTQGSEGMVVNGFAAAVWEASGRWR